MSADKILTSDAEPVLAVEDKRPPSRAYRHALASNRGNGNRSSPSITILQKTGQLDFALVSPIRRVEFYRRV
jgi:hypothetical protein